mmetsp:Transcript_6883/g.7903  ORF Transcript_6883/g.7903 Transcript_6883/m.7903 type:complete len:90 (-) Transcript_6883:1213-1482(-)
MGIQPSARFTTSESNNIFVWVVSSHVGVRRREDAGTGWGIKSPRSIASHVKELTTQTVSPQGLIDPKNCAGKCTAGQNRLENESDSRIP